MSLKIVYSHGRGSTVGNPKAIALAVVAKNLGYEFTEVNYQGIDCIEDRIKLCESVCASAGSALLLAGSSMGAYISVELADCFPTVGLFLLSPAFSVAGYPNQSPITHCESIRILHGWRDSIVPPQDVFDFARTHRAHIEFVDDNHRLLNHIDHIADRFREYLKERLAAQSKNAKERAQSGEELGPSDN